MSPVLDIEDHASLLAYLVHTDRLAAADIARCTTLAGGVSSRTVLVERHGATGWVLKQALPKLRVPMDWFSDPLRVHREAQGLRTLENLTPPGSVPRFIFEDFEQHLFAMEAVPAPHENWKARLLAGHLELELVQQFAQLLATIHREGWLARQSLARVFADRSFFETLRVEPYYECSAQLIPAAAPFLSALVKTTRERQITLVHGDYSPKNILVHGGRLVLLDHEVIHFGDPAFDLGFAMTHLLSKAHHLPAQRQVFLEGAHHFWLHYGQALAAVPWQSDLEWHAIRHTLGCLLARVAGRSPLEYLTPEERRHQRAAVLSLLANPPRSIHDLAVAFLERVTSATT